MQTDIFLFGMLAVSFAMVIAKRIRALVNGFFAQSFFLFLLAFSFAVKEKSLELFIVAGLLLLVKVVIIPQILRKMTDKIRSSEDLGLFVNPAVSIFIAIILTYMAYLFADKIICMPLGLQKSVFTASMAILSMGLFIMIFRAKAFAQVIGLLMMENGLFLAASGISGGMPFFVEIAIFFDVFLCVVILGVFMYRINSLFTHIDVDKLTKLKG